MNDEPDTDEGWRDVEQFWEQYVITRTTVPPGAMVAISFGRIPGGGRAALAGVGTNAVPAFANMSKTDRPRRLFAGP